MTITSRCFVRFGVPHGLNPPEKLGKLRHKIDRILSTHNTMERVSLGVIQQVNRGKVKVTGTLHEFKILPSLCVLS